MTPFPKWNTNIKIQSQLYYACFNKSFVIYVTINIFIYASQQKKSPICKLSSIKAPKTQQAEHCQHPRKTSNILNCHQLRHYASTRKKKLAYLGICIFIIPCFDQGILDILSVTAQKIKVVTQTAASAELFGVVFRLSNPNVNSNVTSQVRTL